MSYIYVGASAGAQVLREVMNASLTCLRQLLTLNLIASDETSLWGDS
jgi:hypothetical protein